MTYSKILVGTDGSQTAQRAESMAARLPAATGAELVIASAYAGEATKADQVLEKAEKAAKRDRRQGADREGQGKPGRRARGPCRQGIGGREAVSAGVRARQDFSSRSLRRIDRADYYQTWRPVRAQ